MNTIALKSTKGIKLIPWAEVRDYLVESHFKYTKRKNMQVWKDSDGGFWLKGVNGYARCNSCAPKG